MLKRHLLMQLSLLCCVLLSLHGGMVPGLLGFVEPSLLVSVVLHLTVFIAVLVGRMHSCC